MPSFAAFFEIAMCAGEAVTRLPSSPRGMPGWKFHLLHLFISVPPKINFVTIHSPAFSPSEGWRKRNQILFILTFSPPSGEKML